MVTLDDIIDTGEIIEDFSSMGHEFSFAFSVLGLVDEQPYIFKQDIETKCETLSTSWSLEFVFNQAPGTNTASCALTARRTDSVNRTVKASIEMSYNYIQNPSHQFQELYTNEYKPGQEIRGFCNDILPFPEESEMYRNGGITVGVSLAIKCCDRE
ncbi:hypothetical protein AVEN_139072-1 [Araneus ventricosus]|uniref:MATH domain-containing protein n=1 Tax=Araneus ventricosus TaxID=182803 RepID=A0A4Y2SZ86_ARAVE|nr:hypothetical protein AVEN_139072-1 [Araneus ventricosus]